MLNVAVRATILLNEVTRMPGVESQGSNKPCEKPLPVSGRDPEWRNLILYITLLCHFFNLQV